MKKNAIISAITGAALMLGACGANDQNSESESFPIINTQGSEIGALIISPLAGGGVELNVTVSGLEPGTRAMHIHETGSCITPDFKSAGGHYNPAGVAHGQIADGPHAGDMMNVEVGADGRGSFTVKNMKVNLRGGDLPALKDNDGSALVIHGGADDYKSQPSGAAGPRVACAEIQ
jgi:Cu-Zn family superoxide dismutase